MGATEIMTAFVNAIKNLPVITETFDGYTSDAEPPAPWMVTKSGWSSVLVSGTVYHLGSKSVRLWSSGGAGLARLTRAHAPSGTERWLYDMWMRWGLALDGPFGRGFELWDNDTTNRVLAVTNRVPDGHMVLENVTGGPIDLGAITQDAWEHILIDVNYQTNTVSIYHNDVLYGPYSMLVATQPTHVRWFNQGVGFGANDLYVDDIEVLNRHYGSGDTFDGYPSDADPPAPWSVSVSGGGTVKVRDTVYQGASGKSVELYSPSGTGSAVLTGAALPPWPGTDERAWFKFYLRYATATPTNGVRSWGMWGNSGATFLADIRALGNGHIYAVDGPSDYEDLGTYSLDTWYEFYVDVDLDNNRYAVYRDGVRYPSTGWLDLRASYEPDQMRVTIIPAGATDTYRLYFDTVSWGSYDLAISEDWEGYSAGAPPSGSWTPSALAESYSKVLASPHQGATGKALRTLSGHAAGWAKAIRPMDALRTVFDWEGYIYLDTDTTGSHARSVALYDTLAASEVFRVEAHSDAFLYFTNGAGLTQGPAYVKDTWYYLKAHVDMFTRTYYLMVGTTRYPTTGTYSLAGTGIPNAVKVEASNSGNGLSFDTMSIVLYPLLTGIEVSPVYPRKSIGSKPFITVRLGSLATRYAWAGVDATGRKMLLREGEVQFAVWVPRAHTSDNFKEGLSDTELLDATMDAVGSAILYQRYTLAGITKPMLGSPSAVGLERDGKMLFRTLPVRFQYWEVF
jgi:hypothetical protein